MLSDIVSVLELGEVVIDGEGLGVGLGVTKVENKTPIAEHIAKYTRFLMSEGAGFGLGGEAGYEGAACSLGYFLFG